VFDFFIIVVADLLPNLAFAGEVSLENVQVRAQALDFLQLPIEIKAGFVGKIKIKVSWFDFHKTNKTKQTKAKTKTKQKQTKQNKTTNSSQII